MNIIKFKEHQKKKLFGLLNEREKNGMWENFLDNYLVELMSLPIELKDDAYFQLYYKVSTCRYLSFKYFRKTIFDMMTLVDKSWLS